ncbi:MAG: aminopeptidase P family protein [Isosphaeraceae bacterium]|nr:aminopeptidase P family protein [Isosphaeraceae bacterium]
MLTAEGCAARRQRLWAALPAPCDVLIVADPQHLVYFANYAQSPFTYRSSDAGAMLLLRPDRAILVADNLLKPFAEQAHVDEVRLPLWYEGKRSAPRRQAMLVRSVLDALGPIRPQRVGIEPSSVPAGIVQGMVSARPDLELVDLDSIIRDLRRVKDEDELALLRQSIRAGEAGHAAALAEIRPGMSEFEAYLLVQKAALEAAGDRYLLYGDFDSGPRAQNVVGPPTQRIMAAGDLFILDFSVVVFGYRGDFANTIVVGGRPSARQQELYEGCVAALAAGEALLRPGASGRDIDAAIRRAFAERGLDPNYPTHTGHGIGLSHPEPPYLVPESDDVLRAGDVVTLEPGQYGPGFGGMRFERNYRITPEGFETLTKHKIALNLNQA